MNVHDSPFCFVAFFFLLLSFFKNENNFNWHFKKKEEISLSFFLVCWYFFIANMTELDILSSPPVSEMIKVSANCVNRIRIISKKKNVNHLCWTHQLWVFCECIRKKERRQSHKHFYDNAFAGQSRMKENDIFVYGKFHWTYDEWMENFWFYMNINIYFIYLFILIHYFDYYFHFTNITIYFLFFYLFFSWTEFTILHFYLSWSLKQTELNWTEQKLRFYYYLTNSSSLLR